MVTNNMRVFWDFLLILSIGIWILGLTAQGYLPGQYSALVLLGLVFFIAMIRAGGSIGRLIRFLFRVSLPIVSLLTFVIVFGKGNWNEMGNLFSPLLGLFVILFGFYVMFGGLFKKGK